MRSHHYAQALRPFRPRCRVELILLVSIGSCLVVLLAQRAQHLILRHIIGETFRIIGVHPSWHILLKAVTFVHKILLLRNILLTGRNTTRIWGVVLLDKSRSSLKIVWRRKSTVRWENKLIWKRTYSVQRGSLKGHILGLLRNHLVVSFRKETLIKMIIIILQILMNLGRNHLAAVHIRLKLIGLLVGKLGMILLPLDRLTATIWVQFGQIWVVFLYWSNFFINHKRRSYALIINGQQFFIEIQLRRRINCRDHLRIHKWWIVLRICAFLLLNLLKFGLASL